MNVCSKVIEHMRLFLIGVPFFVAIGIYENEDPLHYIADAIISPETASLSTKLLLLVVRYCVGLSGMLEAVRLLSIALIATIMILYCFNLCVRIICMGAKDGAPKRKQIGQYISLLLIEVIESDVIRIIALLYLGMGIVIMVFVFYGTLKFMRKLPLFVYLIFPVLSFAFMFALISLLPQATRTHGLSNELLMRWRKNCNFLSSKGSRKRFLFMRKKLTSIRTIRFYCGPFFYLKLETKTQVIDTIMGLTFNAILADIAE
jgi:hypothetical protein